MNKDYIRQLCNNQNPIIFEIGSADGIDTLDFIHHFNHLDFQMFCFEPYEENIKEFKKRICDHRVKLFEGVVGNTDGSVDFYASLGKNIYSGSLRQPGDLLFKTWPELFQKENSFAKTVVQSVKLDTFVEQNKIKSIDFMWLDCQGAEDIVIAGGVNTFANKVKYLYTEYSNQEIYAGEPKLSQIIKSLKTYAIMDLQPNQNGDLLGGDVLLKNITI